MASKISEENRRSQFLWAIGLNYAKIAPELSRYYFSKYQQLQRDDKCSSFLQKICQYCGSLFDGLNSKTRISKKISSKNKKKDAKKLQNNSKNCSPRRKKKSTINILCLVCKKTTVYDGSEKIIRQKEKKKRIEGREGAPTTPASGLQTELPENYSSLSASAKRKWRNKVRINKLKSLGGTWQPETKSKDDNKRTGLLAFLSTIEK
ncbi:uncharacterized protein LOC116289235 [Actinia tenebrosa]|uniref:Uncharacterized protein LOC116289235 n=1 Tax=Actinia tenebrosa TaxID=6105 RepID=A0A6P8HHD4_ACTTE|nr:uncharacterized protein LOC116289235 [Actinia tenebrosa]